MNEEGVKQYFTAKRIAARRLLGKVAGKRMRYRTNDVTGGRIIIPIFP